MASGTPSSPAKIEDDIPQVLQDLHASLDHPVSSLFDTSVPAVPVAAIKALLGVVQRSQAETMMGLQDELNAAATLMIQENRHQIALQSGISLFLKYVTRSFLETPNFDTTKSQILSRGQQFASISLNARDRIATLGAPFIRGKVLTLGWSRVVAQILLQATDNFELIIVESAPEGRRAASCYAAETSIPVSIISDGAVGSIMEEVDMCIVGAEGVVENGGVINQCGTLTLALAAHSFSKPLYVAAESYKFARMYPLSQTDIPQTTRGEIESDVEASVTVRRPSVDLTPANFITLLFTDLGVLTPSAVSDELIRLYQ